MSIIGFIRACVKEYRHVEHNKAITSKFKVSIAAPYISVRAYRLFSIYVLIYSSNNQRNPVPKVLHIAAGVLSLSYLADVFVI